MPQFAQARADPAELARVKARLGEFERLYQHMKTRAPAMRQYPTIWPRYQRAMTQAAQARARIKTMSGLADDGYHYAQAALGREAAQEGLGELGFWPQLLVLGAMGLTALLAPPAIEMVTVKKCADLADKIMLENPGMKREEASRLACPAEYAPTLTESLAKVAMFGAAIVGGIYLINRTQAKSGARRDYLKRYG